MRGNAAAKQRASEILNRIRKIKNPVVVEVGVNRGVLSQQLLSARDDLTMILVDNWKGVEDQPEHYKATKDRNALRAQSEAETAYHRVLGLQKRYPARVTILRMDSSKAAKVIPEVDLVFIDADHSYEGCLADIKAYLPKAKHWIGGHDYKNPDPPFDFTGVDKAVEEVFGEVEEGANVTWFKCLHAS